LDSSGCCGGLSVRTVPLPEGDESPVLQAFAEGRLTHEEAFAGLYGAYGRTTRGWLAARAPAADIDDLLQDVWSIFWRRWREWSSPVGVSPSDPRPLLSFLFRTCHLTLMARRRLAAVHATQSIEAAPDPATDGHRALEREVQLGECFSAARACCDDIDLAVLTGKLSGLSGREIARTVGLTEAAVDHRYRDALTRIRQQLAKPLAAQEANGH
jgi:DNA-directed RNA polymerase specialized sigma24 family protein